MMLELIKLIWGSVPTRYTDGHSSQSLKCPLLPTTTILLPVAPPQLPLPIPLPSLLPFLLTQGYCIEDASGEIVMHHKCRKAAWASRRQYLDSTSTAVASAGGWTRDSAWYGEQLPASRVDAEMEPFGAPQWSLVSTHLIPPCSQVFMAGLHKRPPDPSSLDHVAGTNPMMVFDPAWFLTFRDN